MRAYRLETTVPSNGKLQLNQLPFQLGEAVEIIILALESSINPSVQIQRMFRPLRRFPRARAQG